MWLLAKIAVTPLAGVWIEIPADTFDSISVSVTPLAGVWIEISETWMQGILCRVTPLAGVWIEIGIYAAVAGRRHHSPCGSVDWNYIFTTEVIVGSVTPLAGVWIEIVKLVEDFTNDSSSLPLRECGLKLVSAHMGARTGGHSPCGSVDWNEPEVQKVLQKWVTPLAGVWIEMWENNASKGNS